MAAYVIADVNVTNPELFKKYSEQVPATVEQYGGKYLIRGGEVEKAEGDKCQRCWKYKEIHNSNKICDRCEKAISL